jgi:hypothetical protein
MLFLIGIQFLIWFRQRHHRRKHNIPVPPNGIIFTDAVDAKLFDQDLLMGFKVMCNYCFYKFGLEFSLIAMVLVVWARMDLLADLLMVWVLVLSLSGRAVCRVLFPFLLFYLAAMLCLQYAFYVGLPLQLCVGKH